VSDDKASVGDAREETDGDVSAPNTSHGGGDAASNGAGEDNDIGDLGVFSAQI
jgi:hypothetical protein